MLGPPKRRILDRPVSVSVSLEDLDPANHFNRHRDAILDLSVMRDWVVERYADRGRPSIDPVVFIRFHLIIFLEGIRSERQLVETASLNVAHRWYLGDHFDEPLPDRSSLIKIRQRLGIAIYRSSGPRGRESRPRPPWSRSPRPASSCRYLLRR